MNNLQTIAERLTEVGLHTEPKYRFRYGPLGLVINNQEKTELEAIGKAATTFIQKMDSWYGKAKHSPAGSWLVSVLNSIIPEISYRQFPWRPGLPETFMIDTMWTTEGWRAVEVDVTNRNAFGYPLVMRYLYDLPPLWCGLDAEWRAGAWEGVTQVMANHHRFYEPYFRFFLRSLNGRLVKESDLSQWLEENHDGTKLLDVPILYHSKPILRRFLELATKRAVAIPPKHYLSSKALTAVAWESERLGLTDIRQFLPETHLICRNRRLPEGAFIVKLLQSGGAHGVSLNNHELLAKLGERRKPAAIWQRKLPLAKRAVQYLDSTGAIVTDEFYVRASIFVNRHSEVVDADVTASPEEIVHGSTRSILTVPTLA